MCNMNASSDENRVFSKLAVLNTDTVQGQNLVTLKIDQSTKGVLINPSASISFTMTPVDPHDENWQKCWLFQGADGLAYPAVATADGALLISP